QTGLTEMYEFTLGEFGTKMTGYRKSYSKFPIANVNYINNSVLNAVASKEKDTEKYYIGIYAGTFILLNELFLRMMSSPNILPHIGDVSKEDPTKKLFNPQQFDLDTYFIAKPDEENIMPKDTKRQLYASLFTKTALNFLFDHEYAHIAFGHVDYLATQQNIFTISEDEILNDIPLNSQTLEMDADSFAAHQGLGLLKSINDTPSQLPEYRREFFCDWKNGLSNWFFSIYCLFRIFGYKNFEHSKLLKYSHPPTGIRQRLIAGSLYNYFTKNLNVGIEQEFWEIHHDAIDNVEKAFNEISETILNRNAIDFAYTPEAGKHMKLIVDNWNNVRPKLEKYANGYLVGQ
ncbi:MAG TPA: hypothetical protein VK705_08640, partial [Ferruginibacter sp.]|nr:hypothetical protein [Ferruginibacter sp.]